MNKENTVNRLVEWNPMGTGRCLASTTGGERTISLMTIAIRCPAKSLLIGRHHPRTPWEELRNSAPRRRLQEKRKNDYG
jgi:hypothetical protein